MVERLRYLFDRFVLIPAADHLPLRIAIGMAYVAAFLEAQLTGRGRACRKEIAATHGLAGRELNAAVFNRCAIPYKDIVLIRRVASNRFDARSAPCTHVNDAAVRERLANGQPFLLGVAHATYYSGVLTVAHCNVRGLAIRPPEWQVNDIPTRRFKLRYAIFEAALARYGCGVLSLPNETRAAAAGARAILNVLEHDDGPVLVALDPPWEGENSYVRPYCGAATWRFPLGAVRLSHRSRCPVIPVFPVLELDGSLLLEWGDPVQLHSNRPEELRAAMDVLIGHLERSAGKHRTQFNFETGPDRVWDDSLQSWESREGRSVPTETPPMVAVVPEPERGITS